MSAAAAAGGDEVVDHGEPIDEDEDDNGRWVVGLAAGRSSNSSVCSNVGARHILMQQRQAALNT
jgi:hypothetical protein